ncbi:hypothetical protein HBH64_237330 [Parastagonospora nodorum]|nr:hypothetical protein HBH88_154280 [Parastagonospora nodorum]KAH4568491.1 hypothetical protein HBH83_236700 [Parastagonospora nodorum]KAH4736604.1 hypothetical protein HBH64_237330 [Parastagonospora nodorum]KAH4824147.1 hypothetical protein HBH60_160510 [Parastagonospora nodorum]
MNVREGYRITTLEVVKLIEDFISYLAVAKCIQLRNAQIPKVFYKAASSSIMSNRSIALITDKFSVALLTKLAILNNANVTLVDAVHYSQKLEENYFKVIDALIITLIKDDDDLLGTVNSYIKPPLKRCKTEAADSRYIKLGKEAQLKKTRDKEELAKLDSLLDSDDYCLDSSLDINSKDDLEDEEATIAKDLLTDAYILYFKELLSNNSRIFANAISISKTRAIVLAVLIRYCNLSNLLALQFCFFSDSSLENIGRLTKEEAIKMRIDTTNAISKALAAANKLVALQSYVLGGFVIVCSFRKVDKYVFRAYNTISVTAQRTIIRKGSFYVEKRAILLSSYQQCRDILEKEGLNKLEASRRVIFNCFKMQAIFKIYSSCKVKRFTLNSIKDLFTNLSKDYFLVREARAITKSSLNIVYFNLDSKLELKVLGKQDVKITS